jgi:hypothetical protein
VSMNFLEVFGQVCDEDVDRRPALFARSSTKSTRQASRELGDPRATVHKVLHNILSLGAFSVQPVKGLKPGYNLQGQSSAEGFDRTDNDADFLKKSCPLTRLHSMSHLKGTDTTERCAY